jgi:predicted nucleotide-binding protein (sugar kinase/HSP70/actin superfamily)
MKIGIPKGLLYSKYHVFAETFFSELGAEIVVSPDTNKEVLDAGVKLCVDDACLPVKVFHGHASWLCGKCDAVLVPRFMTIERKKYICPMFCGLPEMIAGSIQNIPHLISEPIYSVKTSNIFNWACRSARIVTKSKSRIEKAFCAALSKQKEYRQGYNDKGFRYTVALTGHSYNIDDTFINMNLVRKLNDLNIGVVTSEHTDRSHIDKEVDTLFKEPFWYFAQQYYGSAVHLYKTGRIDGIVYISSFSCGVDSVVVELIRDAVQNFPFLLLKIDEHTGEAAFDTRIEAFTDMLERRALIDNNRPKDGQHLPCSQGAV